MSQERIDAALANGHYVVILPDGGIAINSVGAANPLKYALAMKFTGEDWQIMGWSDTRQFIEGKLEYIEKLLQEGDRQFEDYQILDVIAPNNE